ncbi:hypothetical protein PSAC2689_20309 [Paraburkholderia sacchari]
MFATRATLAHFHNKRTLKLELLETAFGNVWKPGVLRAASCAMGRVRDVKHFRMRFCNQEQGREMVSGVVDRTKLLI